jgi:hypothetical protein
MKRYIPILILVLISCKDYEFYPVTIAYTKDSLTNRTILVEPDILKIWDYSPYEEYSSLKVYEYLSSKLLIDSLRYLEQEFKNIENGITYFNKDSSNQFCLLFILGDNKNIDSVNSIEGMDYKYITRILTIIERQKYFLKSNSEKIIQNNGEPPPPPIPPPIQLTGRCK